MSFPKKLKRMNVFVGGVSYLGEAKSLTLPKLSRKMDEYRGGGMSGPVKIDWGHEIIELEHEYGGFMGAMMQDWAATTVDAVMIRFVGAYQNDQTGGVDAVEVTVRGRHEEIEGGEAKVAEDTSCKFKTTCSYYRLTINGADVIEIDPIAGVEIVGGVDRNAALLAAITQ